MFVDNAGVRIRYEVEGTGPPLFLHHWSFATLEDWYDYGYVDGLKHDYRLIMHDVRGHGQSDKPREPEAYRLEARVSDVITVLDDLQIPKTHFYGYSMGGWIGYGFGRYAPNRFHSLILGGQHPYAQNLDELREFARTGLDQGLDAFIAMWKRDVVPLSSEQKKRMSTFDFEVLLTVAQDRDSLEPYLSNLTMPCLLILGEEDAGCQLAQQCLPLLPNGQLIVVPGVDHFAGFRRGGLIIPHIKKFLGAM